MMGRSRFTGILAPTFVVALIVLAIVDWHQKRGPFAAPQHLGPGLIVYLDDAPGFWRKAAASPPGQIADEHFNRPLNGLAVAFRQATGIRPTPIRWQVWLGKRAWAHWTPEQTVLAVRPGVLLNTYLWAGEWWGKWRPASAFSETWALHRYEGMLYLSSAPEWRPETIATWPIEDAPSRSGDAIVHCVLSNGGERWRLRVSPEGTWPITGRLAHLGEPAPVAAKAPLDLAWPMPVILSVAAADLESAARLSRMGLDALGCEDSAPTLFNLLRCMLSLRTGDEMVLRLGRVFMEAWLERAALWEMEAWPLPVFESAGARAVALLDIEMDGGEAVPVMAMAARGPGLTMADVAGQWPEQFLLNPYQWHGAAGFRIPLLSELVEVCYAVENERIYGASRESVMEQLMATKPPFEGRLGQASVKLDWAALGSAVARDRRALFQAGYFPGDEPMAFERRFSAILEGMQRLGQAQLVIAADDGHEQHAPLGGALFEGAAP